MVTIGCEPSQARKGAAVAIDSGAVIRFPSLLFIRGSLSCPRWRLFILGGFVRLGWRLFIFDDLGRLRWRLFIFEKALYIWRSRSSTLKALIRIDLDRLGW